MNRPAVTSTAAAVLLSMCTLFASSASPAAAQETTVADARLLESIDHYTGVVGRVDPDRARALLLEVAQDPDDALAQMWIARVYSRGRMGFDEDAPRARDIATGVLSEIRGLAAREDVEALFLMGTAYDEGLGVDVDYAEALRWYKRAAARGHTLANHNVGNMYRDGRGVEIDHATAAMWWLRAGRAGDTIPSLRLGEAFEAGRGVRRDLAQARFWYGRAADRGDASAADALERLGG